MPRLDHLLALTILLGRIGDVGSTLFITPNFVLESNAIARRFKWPTIALGFVLCFAPYVDIHLGVMVAVPSLLITASNLSRGWFARALGEVETEALLLRAASRGSLRTTLSMLAVATLFFCLAGLLLLYLSDGEESLEYWFGLGMLVYAVAVGGHGSIFVTRLFRRARRARVNENAA
jgi:hypothetical protein